MTTLELSAKQTKDLLHQAIEDMTEEELRLFICQTITRYSHWRGAEVNLISGHAARLAKKIGDAKGARRTIRKGKASASKAETEIKDTWEDV